MALRYIKCIQKPMLRFRTRVNKQTTVLRDSVYGGLEVPELVKYSSIFALSSCPCMLQSQS